MEMSLSPCQQKARDAFKQFLAGDDTCFILTGGPGRGKSYMTKVLIDDARALSTYPVVVTATTNKAAKVLQDFVREPVVTIHSYYALRVQNDFKSGRVFLTTTPNTVTKYRTLIILDEASMADTQLWKIIEQYSADCRFLIVGDKDQLAPVGESKPPLFYRSYPTVELQTVMRQAETSEIVGLAKQWQQTINSGLFYPIVSAGVDVQYVAGEEFRALVDSHFTEDTPADKYKIICWKNDTVKAYNQYIRDRFFPEEHYVVGETVVTNNPIITSEGTIYSTDEFAVIRDIKADTQYDIEGYWYTLDRGLDVFCATKPEKVTALLKRMAAEAKNTSKWAPYFLAKDFFADLRPVHACTAHKSQGSSYDVVFIDLDDIGQCFEWETVARLLYVAITRARTKVYLYGRLPSRYTNRAYRVPADETSPF